MKVVVVEPLGVDRKELDRLAAEILGNDVEWVYYENRETDPVKLIQRGEDADAIVVANQPLSGEVIRGFRKLRFLSVAFTGYDHIDMEACREKGVAVSNCAGYSTAAVADLVFGLVINLYRNIKACDSVIRQGEMCIRDRRRTVLELMLSDHPKDCLTCAKSGECDLQKVSEKMGIRKIRVTGTSQSSYPMDTSVSIVRDMNKCIMCRRCETVCNQVQTVGALSGVNRGFEAVVSTSFQVPLNESVCTRCV